MLQNFLCAMFVWFTEIQLSFKICIWNFTVQQELLVGIIVLRKYYYFSKLLYIFKELLQAI